jgi:hypothetical protein
VLSAGKTAIGKFIMGWFAESGRQADFAHRPGLQR